MSATNELSDQAETLRSLQEQLVDHSPTELGDRTPPRVFTITSGKGGVGKTAVVANMAMALAKQGKKILIIDADLGLANIDVVFGLTPRYNLNHFFSGERNRRPIKVEKGIRTHSSTVRMGKTS